MNVIYEGTDITDSIEVKKANIIDNSSGVADSIELKFSDTQGYWSRWKPQKGDKIEVKESIFSSGLMFIDFLEQCRGTFEIRGLSVPPKAKTQNTKSWENALLLNIGEEIANKYGFSFQSFGVENYRYSRIDQNELSDFEFLALRAMLEGACIKITNKKIVMYDEQYMENADEIKTYYQEDLDGDYCFKTISTGIYDSCIVQYNDIKSVFKPSIPSEGPILKKNIYVGSQAEADRYSRGYLRYTNKYEKIGNIKAKLDSQVAAGGNIKISNVGFGDGKYFIEKVIHKLVDAKSILTLRAQLEGY